MFQVEHQIAPQTLDDVAIVINLWLVEQRTLSEMQMIYPTHKNGG
jgi:hypothetical protein